MSNHWYNKDGKLIEGATVKEARKHGLFPSSTTVLDMLKKEGLDIWKIDQAIMSARTFPRPENISDDKLLKLIKEDSKQQAVKAADWGKQFHNLAVRVDQEIDWKNYDTFTHYQFDYFKEWHNKNVKATRTTEYTFVQLLHRFAGTLDKFFFSVDEKNVLLDIKTKETKPDIKIKPYKEWCWQLASYDLGLCTTTGSIIDEHWNVIISSTEIGRIEVKKWKPEEIEHGKQVFLALLQVFKLINKL